MSGLLKLTLACGDYEIVRALKDGTVRPDGIELTVLTTMGSRERHWRMARRLEFDICEFNVGAHFMAHDQGVPLAGLPIYLHRRFRHGFLFVNAKAGIRAPRDLVGKTIGGTNFQPAANIWMRGILEEDYGLPHRQVTWLTDRAEDIEFERPTDLRIIAAPAGKSLETMLAEGEIPALLSPSVPQLLVKRDPRIARLFPDYKTIEIEYFRRTGIFPIMHTTVIKQSIVDAHPWVATNLVKAFDQAKALAYRRTANPRVVPLAWVRTAWEEQVETLGPDPWEYGMGDANRRNLETILRYTHQQGMIRQARAVDELFVPCDLGDAGGEDAGL
jgi:4,5-dihydroxyphthalate decarboxylase